MNSYSRLEINLLPPELLPGPTVRYAMLINIMIILLAVTFVGVSWYTHWMALNVEKETRNHLETQIASKAHIEADYKMLNNIGISISRYGRLIVMAADDYVDMPVILDRLAKVIPDEVFLERVTNSRTIGRGQPVTIGILLTASEDDPDLLLRTLQAFKQDPLFADCFMPVAEFEEVSLDELMGLYQIDWSVAGPDVSRQLYARQYQFEIHARINRPLPDLGLSFQSDVSKTFAWVDPLDQPLIETQEPEPGEGSGEAT